jgi:hypothetical protein
MESLRERQFVFIGVKYLRYDQARDLELFNWLIDASWAPKIGCEYSVK